MHSFRPSRLTPILVALMLAACGGGESPAPASTESAAPTPTESATIAGNAGQPATDSVALKVVGVVLVDTLDTQGAPPEPKQTFAPGDTVLAIVGTDGTGSHELAATWTYGAERERVHHEAHRIEPEGPDAHVFGISVASGLPTGDYRVEISIDGAVAASETFSVR